VDPLGLIDKYGADALRFTLAAMESQGRDIKLDEKRLERYRNLSTKICSAARFLQMNGVGASESISAPFAELPVNRWIIGEVVETLARLDRAFEELRYDEMADAIYHFVWGTFCDWYVELVKGAFDDETRRVAAWAFDQILVILLPLMPFITEELWAAMGERPYELIVAKWPNPQAQRDARAKTEMDRIIDVIAGVRAQRVEIGLPPSARLEVGVLSDADDEIDLLNRNVHFVSRLARVQPANIAIRESITMPGAISDEWHTEPAKSFSKVAGRIRVWSSALQRPSRGLTLVANVEGLVTSTASGRDCARASKAPKRNATASPSGSP